MKKSALKLALALVLFATAGNAFALKMPFPMPCSFFGLGNFCGPAPEPVRCAISGYNGTCIVPMPVLF